MICSKLRISILIIALKFSIILYYFLKRLIFKTLAVFIGSLGSNLTIAVFLHESAITHIIAIVTLETLAVLIFLDAGTLTLTLAVITLEAAAVGIVNHYIAFYMTVTEFTLVDITVLLGQLASAILQIILPGTYIDISVLPDESTLARTLSVKKLSSIL